MKEKFSDAVDYTLKLEATSGAAADGKDSNKITATLSHSGILISGKEINFQVDGGALFPNGEKNISGVTSVFGEIKTYITNIRPETVTVIANSEGKSATVTSIFGDGEGGYDYFIETDIPTSITTIAPPTRCYAYVKNGNGDEIAGQNIDMTITSPAGFSDGVNADPDWNSLTITSGEGFYIDVKTGAATKATITLKSDGAEILTRTCDFY